MQDFEMSCTDCRELIFDYVSDALEPKQAEAVRLHINSCNECKNELEKINAIIGAAASLDELEVPEDVRTAVSERLLREERAMRRRKLFVRAAEVALPFAACIALAIGVFSGGVYEKITDADKMLSAGIVQEAAPDEEKAETLTVEEAAEDTQIAQEPENKSATNTRIKKEQPIQKPKAAAKTEAQPQTEPEQPPPATENNAAEPVADEPVAAEESGEAESIPAPAVFSARAVSEDISSGGGAAYDEATDDAVAYDGAVEESTTSEAAAVSGGGSSAKKNINVPSSCVVTVSDPVAFAEGFGISASGDSISFSISAERWSAFVEYVRSSGARLDADFTGEYSGATNVTVVAE